MSIDMHRFVNVYKTEILIGIKMVSNISNIHIVCIFIIVAQRRALKSGALALYHQRSHLQPASLTSDILNGWILCVGAKLFLTQAIQESRTCSTSNAILLYLILLDEFSCEFYLQMVDPRKGRICGDMKHGTIFLHVPHMISYGRDEFE